MTFLSDADVAHSRAEVATTFVDTVVIRRRGSTTDAEGNPVGTTTVVATVKGRWSPVNPNDLQALELGAQAGQVLDAKVVLPVATDVRPGDYIEVRSKTWIVRHVFESRFTTRVMLSRSEI